MGICLFGKYGKVERRINIIGLGFSKVWFIRSFFFDVLFLYSGDLIEYIEC